MLKIRIDNIELTFKNHTEVIEYLKSKNYSAAKSNFQYKLKVLKRAHLFHNKCRLHILDDKKFVEDLSALGHIGEIKIV